MRLQWRVIPPRHEAFPHESFGLLVFWLCHFSLVSLVLSLHSMSWKRCGSQLLCNALLRCHNDSTHEGDFRIDDMPQSIDDLSFGPRWSRAYERIISGEMPPKEEPQPSPKERYDATEWISLGIQAWDSAQNAKLERVSFKRLTREEYVNTIQDLLGYTYHPTDPGGLPEDPHWHGIERMGSVLSLTPSHVERYIAAAEQALQCVIPLSPPPQPWQWEWTAPGIINWNGYLQKLKQDSNTRKHRLLIGPANNWKHYVGGLNQIQVPYAGQYRITIVASGLRPQVAVSLTWYFMMPPSTERLRNAMWMLPRSHRSRWSF